MANQTPPTSSKHRFLFDQGTGPSVIACKECGSEDVRVLGFRAQAMVQVYLKGLDARCNQCDLFSAYRWTAKTIVWQETFTE